MENSCYLNLQEIYVKFNKFMLKNYIIDLKPYENLINFLSQDSICLDEETMNSIETEFKEKIYEILDSFGSVFVKLNYSAATDSDFLVHKLECFKLEDILIILKASNKLNNNLEIYKHYQNKENQSKLFLILKKFYDIKIENEFRLFIHDKQIKGISQRHLNIYFNYNQDYLNEVEISILNFYENEIKPYSDLFSDNMFIDLLFLEKSKKIKIIDIISEEIRQELKKYSEENCENGYYSKYFLLFNNWESVADLSPDNSNSKIKVIQSNEEIVEKSENLNKFPIEIIGEENSHNINDIINLLNKGDFYEKFNN